MVGNVPFCCFIIARTSPQYNKNSKKSKKSPRGGGGAAVRRRGQTKGPFPDRETVLLRLFFLDVQVDLRMRDRHVGGGKCV